MKQTIYFLCVLISLTFLSSFDSFGQKLDNPITESYIKKHLAKKSPKLFLTPEIEKNLKYKLKTDPLVQKYYQFLKEESGRILETPVSAFELEGFRFEGGRETLRRLGILSMVYRIERNPEILDAN